MKCRKYISGIMIISGTISVSFYSGGLIKEHYARRQVNEFYEEFCKVSESQPQEELPDTSAYEAEADPVSEPDNEPEPAGFTPYMDFAALSEAAPGLTAWLRCENTVIDYPIMYCGDNDYFLNHLPDGTKNTMGSLFLDYRNASDFSDKNSVIYGHNVKNGNMFNSLKHYKKQEYYETYPTIELYTEQGDFIVEFFAGYVVDAQTETVPKKFSDDDEFLLYIEQIRSRSTFESGVEVSGEDRLVSLCTCIYDFYDARYILTGKLVRLSPQPH